MEEPVEVLLHALHILLPEGVGLEGPLQCEDLVLRPRQTDRVRVVGGPLRRRISRVAAAEAVGLVVRPRRRLVYPRRHRHRTVAAAQLLVEREARELAERGEDEDGEERAASHEGAVAADGTGGPIEGGARRRRHGM